MKRTSLFQIAAAATLLSFASCSKDDAGTTPGTSTPADLIPITITAQHEEVSRTAHTVNGNAFNVTWAEGDAFMLYLSSTGGGFTISGSGGGTSATFLGYNPKGTGTYNAIYPASKASGTWANATLSVLGQVQAGATSTAHLAEYDVMTATAANLTSGLTFAHRIAAFRFDVTLPSGKFPKLVVCGTNDATGYKVVDPADGSTAARMVYAKEIVMKIVKSVDANGVQTPADFNAFTATMAVFPSTLTAGKDRYVRVVCTDGSVYNYSATISGSNKAYTAGNVYNAVLTPAASTFLDYDNDVASKTIAQLPALTGSGTPAAPYLIQTANDLQVLKLQVNAGNATYNAATYKLMADITITADEWVPIGSTAKPFKGTFDGNGHSIGGTMAATGDLYEHFGFFGFMDGASSSAPATIKNLNFMANVDFTGLSDYPTYYVGAIVGFTGNFDYLISYDDITNYNSFNGCVVSGDINISASDACQISAGGIGGVLTIADLLNCTMNGNISLTTNSSSVSMTAGGIAGYLAGADDPMPVNISGCSNNGSVKATVTTNGQSQNTATLGGITGKLDANLNPKSCTNAGTIAIDMRNSGYALAGGIVGLSSSVVQYCANTGTMSIANSYGNSSSTMTCVGGIAGRISSNSVKDCSNGGKITLSGATYSFNAGGIAGYALSRTISGCSNSGSVSASTSSSSTTVASTLGGIVGEGSTISDCVNCGKIEGENKNSDGKIYIGGISGNLGTSGTIHTSRNESSKISTISTNAATAYLGRLVGNNTGGTLGKIFTCCGSVAVMLDQDNAMKHIGYATGKATGDDNLTNCASGHTSYL